MNPDIMTGCVTALALSSFAPMHGTFFSLLYIFKDPPKGSGAWGGGGADPQERPPPLPTPLGIYRPCLRLISDLILMLIADHMLTGLSDISKLNIRHFSVTGLFYVCPCHVQARPQCAHACTMEDAALI